MPFGTSAVGAMKVLGGSARFREEPEQFVRCVYHLEREFGVQVNGAGAEEVRNRESPQHLRVPVLNGEGVDSLRGWVAGLGAMLPSLPVMACRARGRAWVDLCVGTPGAREVFPLLVGPGVVPLVTEIPYDIDERDRARLCAAGGLPGV